MSDAILSGLFLPGRARRAQLMRLDSAAILKRFFFCELALIRAQAGWLAGFAPFEVKMAIPRFIWEDAQTADALRRRVYELRYPNRLIEVGDDAPLITIFEEARHAADPATYLSGLGVLIDCLGNAYRSYLDVADDLGDGPTKRFLEMAMREKRSQAEELAALANAFPLRSDGQEHTDLWARAIKARLAAVGGLSLHAPGADPHPPALPRALPFSPAQTPGRDQRYHLNRFYWPDNIDPSYPYGEGIQLQLRSAVSHLNEVWAVDTAGLILDAFADQLGWEFVVDASRWVYDESRHTRMGWTRLREWGFAPDELPLGTYIYDSARDEDPIYRMGMLHYFEAKNIGKKTKRAAVFASYGDAASRHDMDFDWADEGIHAAYGKRWLAALLKQRGMQEGAFDKIGLRCKELVARTVAGATPHEIQDIRDVADRLIAHARQLATTTS
jgi:uncharacterized ferritin-like protein (DUF455 family)